MTKTTRRLIFYFLVLVFLIVAPLTILYSSGYFYDQENKKIIQTGAFFIDSQPKNAKVFINGQFKDTTPRVLIEHLLTGSYEVTVAKDGFWTWKKNLEIKPPLVTEVRNIFLVPQNPKIELFVQNATSSIENYFLTPTQKIINDQASSTISKTIKDAAAWTVFENNIYYLQKSNLVLFKTALDGSAKEQISLAPLPEFNASSSAMTISKNYQIRKAGGQIAIFSPAGELYLLNPTTQLFETVANEVQGAEFSSDDKKLLWWTDHEIWVLWLEDILIQPLRKAGDKELIARFADIISQAIWLPKTNEHIIFVVKQPDGTQNIKLTELDGRDLRNTFDIYSDKNVKLYWSAEDKLLYLKAGEKLYSVDLIKS